MNQYLSSVSLKSLAKGQLLGKYGTVVGILILQLLCTAPINLAISTFIGTNGLFSIILYSIAQFLFGLFAGYFFAGQNYVYLKIACNQMPMASDLFYFFREDASKVIYIQVILSGVSTLCSLPSLIAGYYVNLSILELASSTLATDELPVNGPLFLTYAILYVAGSAINIYVRYILFSQVFYLMLDFPDYPAPQLLKMSMQLIKGSRARCFYLLVSFVPLLLLGVFSCGIALLWIQPYMQATYANFYLDLIKKKK
ncbi:MAG: DUF975 family protein [Lachnospiraceae bacterium]|nr:DUF975 family protein [Lachnospiraceae bacterium]